MHITDPVADMLTRIRNANNAKHDTVDVPASNMKKSIAQILLDEGYIKNFQVVEDGTQGVIHISLKYNAGKEKVITGLRRVSKPGLRLLAVDGVTPSNETIADQSYPLCNEFYAAILQDSAADSPERRIYEWLSTDAGRSCIEHSGYVAVQ